MAVMTGRQKLAAYLESHGLTQLAFAELADVPGPQVSLWLSGRRKPGRTNALKIERATDGAVASADWDEPERGGRASHALAARAVHDKREPKSSEERLPKRRHARSIAAPRP